MVNQLKIGVATGALLTVGLGTSFESLAETSPTQVSPGIVIAKDTTNKAASPFNLSSYIVVLDEEPLISFENHRFSRDRSSPLTSQSPKLAARQAQAQLIEEQQSAFASSINTDLPDSELVHADTAERSCRSKQRARCARDVTTYRGKLCCKRLDRSSAHGRIAPARKAPEAWALVGGRDTAGRRQSCRH